MIIVSISLDYCLIFFLLPTIPKPSGAIWTNSKRNHFGSTAFFLLFPRSFFGWKHNRLLLNIHFNSRLPPSILPPSGASPPNSVLMGTNLTQMSPRLMSCQDNNYTQLQLLLPHDLKSITADGKTASACVRTCAGGGRTCVHVSHNTHAVSCFPPRAACDPAPLKIYSGVLLMCFMLQG